MATTVEYTEQQVAAGVIYERFTDALHAAQRNLDELERRFGEAMVPLLPDIQTDEEGETFRTLVVDRMELEGRRAP